MKRYIIHLSSRQAETAEAGRVRRPQAVSSASLGRISGRVVRRRPSCGSYRTCPDLRVPEAAVVVEMEHRKALYDHDLAYVHDVGFTGFADGAAPGLLSLFADAGVEEGRIVDLGCGTGIWAERLTDAGYQVVGLDVSPAMIELARRRVPSAEFLVGSIWDHDIPCCRGATAFGEVVCYRSAGGGRQHLGSLFRKVFDALQPGGLFVFDVAEVGLDRSRRLGFVEGNDWACLVRIEYDQKRHRLARQITTFRKVGDVFRRSRERHVLQLYQAKQVAHWLRKAGFRVRTVRRFGSHPLLPKRVGFVARKP
jgi:SAM-dependent methyltransferase